MYDIYKIETILNYNKQNILSKSYVIEDDKNNFTVNLLVNEFVNVIIFQYQGKTNYIDLADGEVQYKTLLDIIIGIENGNIYVGKEVLDVS